MIRSPDPPESGVLACVRSTDPQCTRALFDSRVLMPIIRSPDSSVSGALVCSQELDLVLELVVNMMHDMREFMVRQQQSRVITPPIVQPGHAREEIVERVEARTGKVGREIRRPELEGLDIKTFQDLRPPMYSREWDYRIIDKWIVRMEKILTYMRCSEEQK
ncbi:hypothetical protein ACLOJK_027060, partial [Asimina triloba]